MGNNVKSECGVVLYPYDVVLEMGGGEPFTEYVSATDSEHAAFLAGVLAASTVLSSNPTEAQIELFAHNISEHMTIDVYDCDDDL